MLKLRNEERWHQANGGPCAEARQIFTIEEMHIRDIRSASLAILVTGWLTAFGTLYSATASAQESQIEGTQETIVDEEFQTMMAKVDTAQLELQNGRPEPFKALWSHADDVTLTGGFGGAIEKGWEKISRRFDWVATQFSERHTYPRADCGKCVRQFCLRCPDRAYPLPRSRTGKRVNARLQGNNDLPPRT